MFTNPLVTIIFNVLGVSQVREFVQHTNSVLSDIRRLHDSQLSLRSERDLYRWAFVAIWPDLTPDVQQRLRNNFGIRVEVGEDGSNEQED